MAQDPLQRAGAHRADNHADGVTGCVADRGREKGGLGAIGTERGEGRHQAVVERQVKRRGGGGRDDRIGGKLGEVIGLAHRIEHLAFAADQIEVAQAGSLGHRPETAMVLAVRPGIVALVARILGQVARVGRVRIVGDIGLEEILFGVAFMARPRPLEGAQGVHHVRRRALIGDIAADLANPFVELELAGNDGGAHPVGRFFQQGALGLLVRKIAHAEQSRRAERDHRGRKLHAQRQGIQFPHIQAPASESSDGLSRNGMNRGLRSPRYRLILPRI